VPEERLAEITLGDRWLSTQKALAAPDLRLAGGSLVPAGGMGLRVVATPGHVCLVDEAHGLIFSGDHVLPRISPNISLQIPGPANPLADYYQSLDLIGFDDEMEVCPAHEYRFSGMRRRVEALLEDNRARSAEVLRVLAGGAARSVWDIARSLSWSRGWDCLQGPPLRLALAETASHLVYLESQGFNVHIPVRDPLPTVAR
jgi:glyoxylase-like metal-dependent hydrolase (beta-lactamase superfamily II)